jgi:hypothetical protein
MIAMPTPFTIGATMGAMGIMKLWNKFVATPFGAAAVSTMGTVTARIGSGMASIARQISSSAARIGGAAASVARTIAAPFAAAFSPQALGFALANRLVSAVASLGECASGEVVELTQPDMTQDDGGGRGIGKLWSRGA